MSPAPAASPAQATLRRTYPTPDLVQALVRALSPDNAGFLRCRAEGRELVLEAQARSVAELQRTLDDALACLSAAERTWEGARGSAPSSSDEGDEERDA